MKKNYKNLAQKEKRIYRRISPKSADVTNLTTADFKRILQAKSEAKILQIIPKSTVVTRVTTVDFEQNSWKKIAQKILQIIPKSADVTFVRAADLHGYFKKSCSKKMQDSPKFCPLQDKTTPLAQLKMSL